MVDVHGDSSWVKECHMFLNLYSIMHRAHWKTRSSASRPNEAASPRLVGAILAEQNDE